MLIVAMAIMNGFDKEFERKLFAMNYPITIYGASHGVAKSDVEELKNKFPQMKFSPYINSQVIIKNGEKLEGGIIFGVNLDDEIQINSVILAGLV